MRAPSDQALSLRSPAEGLDLLCNQTAAECIGDTLRKTKALKTQPLKYSERRRFELCLERLANASRCHLLRQYVVPRWLVLAVHHPNESAHFHSHISDHVGGVLSRR